MPATVIFQSHSSDECSFLSVKDALCGIKEFYSDHYMIVIAAESQKGLFVKHLLQPWFLLS
jgi:hypothetical protein